VKVSVCCEYPNRTPCTSAVVLQCSHIPVALSPCYRFCFSALHTSQTPASVSPATFQAMMDSIFSDMIEGQKVIVYMDNILIFAENQEELQERTKQVL
jgi:Reverse transcriptase (RNA-dependent DNA polymerase)